MKQLLVPCLIATLAAAASAADKPETRTNSFLVPEHGQLLIKAPKSWAYAEKGVTNSLGPRTAELSSSVGDISVQITVSANSISRVPGTIDEKFEQIVKAIGDQQYVEHSVEKKVVVEKFSGPNVSGRFARFTDPQWVDKTPPAGEFSHVTTGVFQCGDLWGTFTLLTQDKDGPQFKQVMAIIESLEKEKPAP